MILHLIKHDESIYFLIQYSTPINIFIKFDRE